MFKLFTKVRLSVYFYVLLAIYLLVAFLSPKYKFESTALTLFSVNSFLYGFYISPILGGQKSRIEELHKLVRAESNALFSMMIKLKHIDKKLYKQVDSLVTSYIRTCIHQKRSGQGELEYEELIRFCLEYKGKEAAKINTLLEQLVANEANRTSISMQLNNKVFANEWWIMYVLFSITLSFVALLDIGSGVFLNIVQALLCTGLTMLLIILGKLSSLTHKKAKKIWDPYQKLLDTNYHQID
jgi:hypothetical protein